MYVPAVAYCYLCFVLTFLLLKLQEGYILGCIMTLAKLFFHEQIENIVFDSYSSIILLHQIIESRPVFAIYIIVFFKACKRSKATPL